MNEGAIAALAVAVVFAAADWVSRSKHDPSVSWRRVEYVCKPATMVALIAAAAWLDPAAGADARQRWFVAALVFSLAGDVFLMLPREQFVAGLTAFLVAHLCYTAGFWTEGPEAIPLVVASAVVIVAIGALATSRILPGVRRHEPALLGPVAAYMVVIGVMVATALATGNVVAGIGAVSFAVSDSMIAWDRFVGPFPRASVWIMVTYHLGQALLVCSLVT